MKCIICGKNKKESDEHIIPESLGNKKLITRRVCEECNNRLGANIDDYLTNHPIVKIIRTNEGLLGKGKKEIKFFSGIETDHNTGLKYDMKSGKPKLQPRMILNNEGHFRIEAANVSEGLEYFKKIMSRKGYSTNQIEEFCKNAISGNVELKSPPEFTKDATVDFARFGLSAIKIAFEYAFEIFGESYLNDEVALLFSKELYKNAYSSKKEIKVSDSLARFVTFPISGSGVENILRDIKQNLSCTNMDVLHVIFFIKQDTSIYCVLYLCMLDILTFVVKITENEENYKIHLPFTFVFKDGTVESL